MDALLGLFRFSNGAAADLAGGSFQKNPVVPSLPLPDTRHPRLTSEVGKDAAPRMYLPDKDPETVRLVQRFRLTRKAPADKRLHPENAKSMEKVDPSRICQTEG